MHPFNLITAALGGMVLLLGLGSKRLSAGPFPPTLLALLIGVLLGPEVVGLIDLAELGETPVLLERLARLTLGIGLVGVALRLPHHYPQQHWRAMLVLTGIGMCVMWGICILLVVAILGQPLWLAALIAAAITPTDPVAATPIVTGTEAHRNLPGNVRHSISLDSGVNDGLAYLFVFLPFLLIQHSVGEALSRWLIHTLLWEVGVAAVVGLLLGYIAGRLLRWAENSDLIESDWRLIYTVALALFAVGAGRLIGSDEVLLVFAAGAAFDQVVSNEDRKSEGLGQEAVNRFFSVPIFTVIGLTIPWQGWLALGWPGLVLAVAVLLLRRPLTVLLLYRGVGTIHNFREALFIGWFGPIAVSAVYYAGLMEHRLGEPVIWHVVSLVVCCSVMAHGMTAIPVTRWFGRAAGQQG